MLKINRSKSKGRICTFYAVLSLWVVGALGWYHFHYRSVLSNEVPHSIYNMYDEPPVDTDAAAAETAPDFDYKNSHIYKRLQKNYNAYKEVDRPSSVYHDIFKNHAIESVVRNLDFNQRCDLYFRNVFLKNHNWVFDPNANYEVDFGKKFEEFQNTNSAMLQALFDTENSGKKVDNYDKKFADFKREFYKKQEEENNEQRIVDELTLFRLYNKCYVTDDDPVQEKRIGAFVAEQKDLIDGDETLKSTVTPFRQTTREMLVTNGMRLPSLDHRIYPWLSLELPVFERWTGQIHHEIPNFREILRDNSQPPKRTRATKSTQSTSFFKNFKNNCNGKGIVLTIADKHADYTANFVRLLRALNNKLPIQIVYFDNLGEESKRKIVTAARESFSYLPQSFHGVSEYFPQDYLDPKSDGLPKQEVWFVNVASVIGPNFKGKFTGYASKLLATLFNSFDEFMLVDADTALMQDPESFFEMKGYQETGTFFFKDRAYYQKTDGAFAEQFKRISQSPVDKVMFDINPMTNHSFRENFFQNLFHTMESGVVLIDRQRHFNSVLMIVHINFFKPISSRSWGDKELFWFGFAFNGDEDYHFNAHGAAAIGEMTNPSDRRRPDRTLHHSKELCSPHPGHISEEDNHTLLWINSGFRYCHQADKVDFEKESKLGRRLKFLDITAAAFREYYYNPLKITHAIIPPFDPEIKNRPNLNDEPSHGWLLEKGYCKGYLWCAYSSIGGITNKDTGAENTMEGTVVTFNEKERALFDYYGDIWVGME
ncbi:uncharacterized protein LODBEIA_P53260 [Lodderomyces beijingensis]|uniref:Alpha-1,3-mannosyltransferase n=1 Tax=Lodderomyces beijingensis TaxID=1775926 RepID=A0ABP0ZW63_9ASCO